jgi:hypothetical protein
VTKPDERVVSQRRNILSALVTVPFIVWEIYEVQLGSLVQSLETSPSFLLFFSFFGALFAAWHVIVLEYLPKWTGLNRTTRVWFGISLNLWSAGLILLWLEPQLAKIIMVSFFALTDLTIYLMARDLLHRVMSGVAYRSRQGQRPVIHLAVIDRSEKNRNHHSHCLGSLLDTVFPGYSGARMGIG